ncbi:MAG: hypothetical protein OEZ13_02230 [Spirochaetia bacterium]|nr:hypothetical protein [Spirochaetia bacterium]
MTERKTVFLLILTIFFFSGIFVFVLDNMGITQVSSYIPFLAPKNPPVLEDKENPSIVEKVSYNKWEEMLAEREEKLAAKEVEFEQKIAGYKRDKKILNEYAVSMLEEQKNFLMQKKDWEYRNKRIEDMAQKVASMPPEKAKEMMEDWRDFDIIEVFRQMDKTAELEGRQSIVSYLLTLFEPKRRAEISRKMLLPPIEQNNNIDVDIEKKLESMSENNAALLNPVQ